MAKTDKMLNKAPSERSGSSASDFFMWMVVFLVVAVGFVANAHYETLDWAVRLSIAIVLVAMVLLLSAATSQGKRAVAFMKLSRVEMRKVFWPTRQEALQTALMVVVIVILAALALWGMDGVFKYAVGWLAGQRG